MRPRSRAFIRRARTIAAPIVLIAVAAIVSYVLPGVGVVAGAETYAQSNWTACGAAHNGGQYDEQKRLYMGCGTSMLLQQPDGTWVDHALGATVLDVAPSPTGAHAFVLSGGKVLRYARAAGGTYKKDTTWTLPTITADGSTFPANVAAIASDAEGNLYVSHTYPADNVVTKHAPSGAQLTWFGGFTNTAEVGKFNLNRGVAPSRDGRYVYVVEKSGGRMQRFDYQVDGSYKPARAWGRQDVNCSRGNFAAPGDAVVDPWGFVYVMDTTCARVQKFTADGQLVWVKPVGTPVTNRSHRFAVDWRGSVYVAEQAQRKLIRAAGTEPTAAYPALQPLPEPDFAAKPATLCPATDWTIGAGQAAKDGTVYVACGRSIAVGEAGSAAIGRIALPTGAHYMDVAPSPDESVLYVTRRVSKNGRAELRRLLRQGAAGSLTYTLDAAWKPKDYQLGARSWTPQGQWIATDAWGDVYYSVGGWAGYFADGVGGQAFVDEPSPAIIVKYTPSGDVVTQLTGTGELGEFDVNMGIAVSRDGRTIWAVEQKQARLRRFDYTPTGAYAPTPVNAAFARRDPTCASDRGLLSPYDVGIDPWGAVWIANTGCRRLEKYAADGAHRMTVKLPDVMHGVAVDLVGNAWVGQTNTRVQRSPQHPVPGPVPALRPLETPDTAGPAIAVLRVPNGGYVDSSQFQLTIAASDASTISHMRLAGEDGNWSDWLAFQPVTTITSSPGIGPKSITVQLRDEFGQESAVASRQYAVQAPNPCGAPPGPDPVAPVLGSVTIPTTTTTRSIVVGITASDAVCVAQMQLTDESGSWATGTGWIPFNEHQPFTLSATSATAKGVYVQVRDAAGNESGVIYRQTTFLGDRAAVVEDDAGTPAGDGTGGEQAQPAGEGDRAEGPGTGTQGTSPAGQAKPRCKARLVGRVVRLTGCPRSARVQQQVGRRWTPARSSRLANRPGVDQWRVVVGSRVVARGVAP